MVQTINNHLVINNIYNQMKKRVINLIIIEDDFEVSNKLVEKLLKNYGALVNIRAFNNSEIALEKINIHTDLIIIDTDESEERLKKLEHTIGIVNPKIEILKISSFEDLGFAIDTFIEGVPVENDRKDNAMNRILSGINYVILFPVNFIVREFAVSKYIALFIMTFLTMAIAVVLVMKFVV